MVGLLISHKIAERAIKSSWSLKMFNQSAIWLSGESVSPRKVDDVTMLFSDLVGFTAICSRATPLQVISMLNSLYTQFDACCGWLDVYKV